MRKKKARRSFEGSLKPGATISVSSGAKIKATAVNSAIRIDTHQNTAEKSFQPSSLFLAKQRESTGIRVIEKYPPASR